MFIVGNQEREPLMTGSKKSDPLESHSSKLTDFFLSMPACVFSGECASQTNDVTIQLAKPNMVKLYISLCCCETLFF